MLFGRKTCSLALALCCWACPVAQAAPLVINGGFESPPPGSLDGWNVPEPDPAPGPGFVTCITDPGFPEFIHSGTGSAGFFSYFSVPSILFQDLGTVVGHQYLVEFFAAAGDTPFSSTFDASFAGTTLATAPTLTTSYTPYSFLATATSSLTTLSFTATWLSLDPPELFLLDDVAVTDITAPEMDPNSALAPLVLAAGMLLLVSRRVG